MFKSFQIHNAVGILVDSTVYVLKPSSSSYGLWNKNGLRLGFCCQDGCCDRGLQHDVADIVERAKAAGAAKVVIRTGQRGYYVPNIAGLPVEDVSDHVGPVGEDFLIHRGWRLPEKTTSPSY